MVAPPTLTTVTDIATPPGYFAFTAAQFLNGFFVDTDASAEVPASAIEIAATEIRMFLIHNILSRNFVGSHRFD